MRLPSDSAPRTSGPEDINRPFLFVLRAPSRGLTTVSCHDQDACGSDVGDLTWPVQGDWCLCGAAACTPTEHRVMAADIDPRWLRRTPAKRGLCRCTVRGLLIIPTRLQPVVDPKRNRRGELTWP
jgi:hypothetical protein